MQAENSAESVGGFTAAQVAAAMYAKDICAQHHGMKITEIGLGFATLEMQVTRQMLNGHAICHGGFVFMLADTAFAYACNSYNQNTVAAGCSIEFLAATQLGDTLTATAQELVKSGRSGVYDISVRNQKGEAVAVFRGKSATIKGTHLVA